MMLAVVITIIHQPILAQHITEDLTEVGYENVAASVSGNHLYITYENRIYRSEARALADVLLRIHQASPAADTLTVLIRHNDLPTARLTTATGSLNAFLQNQQSYSAWLYDTDISLGTHSAEKEIEHVRRINRSRYKLDIPVGLGMRYQLGNYNDPFQFAFDLEPELRMQLAAGFTASARFALPVYNNFDRNTYVRPVRLILSREFKPEETLYTTVSAGMFGRNRAGIHAGIKKYFYREVLSAGIKAGYTTFTGISGKVTFPVTERRDFFFYTASVDYRWRRYDLNIRAEYGNFLYQDQALVLDINRQFGEVTGGFFLIQSDFGNNAGFRFSIPIFPSQYPSAGVVRIRPARSFSLNYRYQGNDFTAREYDTGTTASDLMPEWYPSFLEKELEKHLVPPR
jgi:hypothetical protein